jgi:threonine/homoserine/homoserine lactone efflux protein
MMNSTAFIFGALALLATPGPTNTLLATSGAARGLRASLGLLVGELLGYLLAISVLIAAVGPMIAAMPAFGVVLRLVVGVYVLYLAWVLWRQSELHMADARPVTPLRVFVPTLFNPKAAIFAFTLLPDPSGLSEFLPRFGVLSLLIVTVGFSWIAGGASLKRGLRPQTGYRAGAVALAVIAVMIGGSAIGIVWRV